MKGDAERVYKLENRDVTSDTTPVQPSFIIIF